MGLKTGVTTTKRTQEIIFQNNTGDLNHNI